MNIEQDLTHFLKTELVRERTSKVMKFTLRHAAPGSRGQDIDEWGVSGERITLDDCPRLAADIAMRAQTDADGMGAGPQRYVVVCVTQGDARSMTRFAMTLRGQDDDDGGEDSPTMKGIISQLMRHNEAITRTMVTAVGAATSQLVRRMEDMGQELNKLHQLRQESYTALEAARSEEHEREMSAMEAMSSNTRKDKAFETLLKLGPVVVNRLAGKTLVPTKTDPQMMMLENLVGSLTHEQLMAIGSNLQPEQQLQFMEILQAYQRKQAAEAAKGDDS